VTGSPTGQLRLGVLGCGQVFQRFHLPALARFPAIQLAAASDTDPNRDRWARDLPPHTALCSSLETLLHRGPDLDALLILTPPQAHAEAVVPALQAGLHVLVEKPMALDVTDGARMVEAATRAGRRLQVGFSRRFRRPYRQLHSLTSELDRSRLREVRFELAFPSSSWRAQTDFLGNQALGGGVFDDVLSHQIDLIRWMFGQPQEVRAIQQRSEDGPVRAEFRLGDLLVRCDAAHGSYAERIEVMLADGRVLEATGSRLGKTRSNFPALRRGRALLQDRMALLGNRLLGRPNVTVRSFEDQLRDFERGVRGGHSEGASGEDGLRAVEIVHACKASADGGGTWRKPNLNARPAA
jgi:predicted dehydrogenase